MSFSSSSNAGGVVSSTDIGFDVKASHRKQRGPAKRASGKKGAFNIFEDEQPKSAVVNKAQLDALYDGRSARSAPVPVSEPSAKSLASHTERKAPGKTSATSPVHLAKATTSSGMTWATVTAPTNTAKKRSTSSMSERPPAPGSYAISFPDFGQKQASASKTAAPAAATTAPSKSDSAHRASDDFTVVDYTKRGKEKRPSSPEGVTIATNMANNKFEPLMSQDDSQEQVRAGKPKPVASSAHKKKDGGASKILPAGPNTSPKSILQKENLVWPTIGSKKPSKPTTKPLKQSSANTKAPAPRSQKPVSSPTHITPTSSHQDPEFPPLAPLVTNTEKVSSKTSVVEAPAAHKSHPHQPASPLPATTTLGQHKDAEFPPLSTSPTDTKKMSSKSTVVQSSKSRRRKRASPERAIKTLIKPTSVPITAQAEVVTTGESKKHPEVELKGEVTSSLEVDKTAVLAPVISVDDSTLACGEVDDYSSPEPSTTPKVPHEDTHQNQTIAEPFVPFGVLATKGFVYDALDSQMTLCFGFDDFRTETEEHQESVSTIEPAAPGEAHQYQQVVETCLPFGASISECFDYAVMESRTSLHFGPDDFVSEADNTSAAINGLFSEGCEHNVIESRTNLCFGFDDFVFEVDDKSTIVNDLFADGFENYVIESRRTLRFEFEAFFDEADDTSVAVNDLYAEGFEHDVIESRMALRFGFDDFDDEPEELVKPDATNESISTIASATQAEADGTTEAVSPVESRVLGNDVADDFDTDSHPVSIEVSMDDLALGAQATVEDIIEMSTKDDALVAASEVGVASIDQSLSDAPATTYDALVDGTSLEVEQHLPAITPCEEVPLASEEGHIELAEDVQRLCYIALAELITYDGSDCHITKGDLSLLLQEHDYGQALLMLDEKTAGDDLQGKSGGSSCTEHAADTGPASDTPTPTSAVTRDTVDTEVFSPKPEVPADNSLHSTATSAEAHNHQSFMGIARITDILEELIHKPSKNGLYTKAQVVEVFALFSTRERKLAGFDPLCDISKGRNMLKSVILQHKICLGRTTLTDFLEMIGFEHKLATMEAVAAACMLASQKEVEFWQSEVSKKIGEIMRTLA